MNKKRHFLEPPEVKDYLLKGERFTKWSEVSVLFKKLMQPWDLIFHSLLSYKVSLIRSDEEGWNCDRLYTLYKRSNVASVHQHVSFHCLHQGLHKDYTCDHEDGSKRFLRLLGQPKQGNQYGESGKEQKMSLNTTCNGLKGLRRERIPFVRRINTT